MNKRTDIPAGASLPEKGWAVHQNDRLRTCEQEQEDREDAITICKMARLEFRPRREPRFTAIDYFATISCIQRVRDSDSLRVLVLGVMLFRMNFLVFLEILGSFESLFTNLKKMVQNIENEGLRRGTDFANVRFKWCVDWEVSY